MPLRSGSSRADFEHNLKVELEAGKARAQALAIAYTKQAGDAPAIDPDSVRVYDPFDGKMHVTTTHITKAMVCPYYGREIPEAAALGLDLDKVYMLLRDPDEIEKAAVTSNGIPLFDVHIVFNAEGLSEVTENLAGTVGTNAKYNHPYLDNSIVFWNADTIEDVESEEKRELSCCYRYKADMTPGVYEGVSYDGIMRDIVFNHLATVYEGRAGSDVLVADSKGLHMPKSRRALMMQGALAASAAPFLVADAKIDFGAILKDVDNSNFKAKRPVVLQRFKSAIEGKVTAAFDAKMADKALDAIEKEDCAEDDDDDEKKKAAADRRAKDRKAAMDRIRAADGDMDEETAEDAAAREESDRAEDARRARDGEGEETEEQREERYTRDRKRAKDKKAKDKRAKDGETQTEAEREMERAKDKKAMDARLAQVAADTRRDTMAQMRDLTEARRLVAPHIGEVSDDILDPKEVLALAFDGVDGITLDGTESLSVLKNMIKLLPDPNATITPPMAFDSAGTANDVYDAFPGLRRIRKG